MCLMKSKWRNHNWSLLLEIFLKKKKKCATYFKKLRFNFSGGLSRIVSTMFYDAEPRQKFRVSQYLLTREVTVLIVHLSYVVNFINTPRLYMKQLAREVIYEIRYVPLPVFPRSLRPACIRKLRLPLERTRDADLMNLHNSLRNPAEKTTIPGADFY